MKKFSLLLLLLIPSTLGAQDFTGIFTFDQTAAQTQIMGPGSPLTQVELTKIIIQGAAGGKFLPWEGVWLSGTSWGRLRTLASDNPMELPENKIELSSRILEACAGWETLPGVLSIELGKRVSHPSAGFYTTPLNVLTRGKTSPGKALGDWEEGWTGINLTWFHEVFTLNQFFSPRMEWSEEADNVMTFLSAQQSRWQSLTQVSVRVFEVDIKTLGLASTSDGTDWTGRGGLGLEGLIGDGLTLRSEGVLDWEGVQAMAGFTWTWENQLSIMGEFSLDREDTETFLRIAGPLAEDVSGEIWTSVYLADRSGLSGASAKWTKDHWNFKASWLGPWGPAGSKWGDSSLKWNLKCELGVNF